MERIIKLRVWDLKFQQWAIPNDVLRFGCGNDILTIPLSHKDRMVIQQFVGLPDKNNKDVYQGDIVKFKYSVGDFAWEFMDKKETEKQHNMLGKEYVGVVSPNIIVPINMDIICGNPKSTHMIFPLIYASQSEIIGNIFETPELKGYVE